MVLHLDLEKKLPRLSSLLLSRSVLGLSMLLFRCFLLRFLFLMRLLSLFVWSLFLLLPAIAWIVHVSIGLKLEECLVAAVTTCCCSWPYRVVVILQNEMHRSMKRTDTECEYDIILYVRLCTYTRRLNVLYA